MVCQKATCARGKNNTGRQSEGSGNRYESCEHLFQVMKEDLSNKRNWHLGKNVPERKKKSRDAKDSLKDNQLGLCG